MEDTKSLLIMVLQKVFKDRPKIIEETFRLIYSYNNGRKEKLEYEKTLRTICELMNEELPSQILVYLLTIVDMPTEGGFQLPIMEKMQKTQSCLPESVRPHLLEFLRNKRTTCAPIIPLNNISEKVVPKEPVPEPKIEEPTEAKLEETASSSISADLKPCENQIITPTVDEENFPKPTNKKPRLKKKFGKSNSDSTDEYLENPKTLLDLCAAYVIQNEKKLKQTYKQKQEKAWKMINNNLLQGETLQQCYTALEDLNKKCKWLRMVENDNVTADVLMEEYKDSDVFLKERHLYEILNEDPFELSQKVINYIDSLQGSLP